LLEFREHGKQRTLQGLLDPRDAYPGKHFEQLKNRCFSTTCQRNANCFLSWETKAYLQYGFYPTN